MRYKVKRFSQCNISELTREERYYSIRDVIEGARYSGLKRSLKREIGRLRVNKAYKLKDEATALSITPNPSHINKRIMIGGALPNKFELENNLIKELNGTKTVIPNKARSNIPSYMSRVKNITKNDIEIDYGKENLNKVRSELADNHYMIYYKKGIAAEELAHEIGHIKNDLSKNPIKKIPSNIVNGELGIKGDGSVSDFIKNKIRSKAKIIDETNANESALKSLKKAGADKNELNLAENQLHRNLDTYKSNIRSKNLEFLSEAIQIPSLKRNRLKELGDKGMRLPTRENRWKNKS